MPAERKYIAKARRKGTLMNAASALGTRGTRNDTGQRNGRAALELMREIGYGHPAAIGEFLEPRC